MSSGKNRAKNKRKRRITEYKTKNMVDKYVKHPKCKKCGCTDFAIVYKEGNNSYGLYCSSCGFFVKFLNKDEKRAYGVRPSGRTAVSKTVNQSSSL